MSNIVTVGYVAEGSTDRRFLETIIAKTVEEVALTCDGQIDVYDPIYLKTPKSDNFVDLVIQAARLAFDSGISILCVHTDADHSDDSLALGNKINPAIEANTQIYDPTCKIIVPIIPVTMSESWMLADTELLRDEMGTGLTNEALNINVHPEEVNNPKALIENALRIAQANLPQRRFKLTISELYQPIGQKIQIDKLNQLQSFKKFRASLENAFRQLNYLH
jgi:hypothetical protein